MKGDRGREESAAQYEYVRSPSAFDFKYYLPPIGTVANFAQVPQNKNDIKCITVRMSVASY
jgi:hypothetical protein